jgi:hypothetical protein
LGTDGKINEDEVKKANRNMFWRSDYKESAGGGKQNKI